jgi:hypothetical protein
MELKIIGYLAPEQDAHLVNSAAAGIAAGRDVISTHSGCQIGVAGRDLTLNNGTGGLLVAGNQAHITNSKIGILLGKKGANLQDSEVMLTGRQAAAMGVIAGVVCALVLAGLKARGRMLTLPYQII